MKQFRIRKDDKVMVIAGKDQGKIGKVLKVLHKHDSVVVEKVNVAKRHVKPNPYRREPGGIVERKCPSTSPTSWSCAPPAPLPPAWATATRRTARKSASARSATKRCR